MAIELLRRRPVSELQPGKAALRLITSFEGLSLKAYRDSVGIPTCGYGHTGDDVFDGMQITLAQADAWLREDIEEAASIVRNAVRVPLTQGEFDSLVSITFNIGRIPKSMLAALNGGSSDKGEVFSPGSYGSALKQFPRNCRAGGIPLRGLYRRRLAEACTFSDLPFEDACSISVVKLEVDAAKNIVPSGTTSLEDTLMRARQDLPILRPDTSDTMRAPWPAPRVEVAPAPLPDAPIASQDIPVQLPIPDADELLLDQPAASESIPDTTAAAPSHPQPERGPTAQVSKSDQQPSNSKGPMSASVEKSAAAPASPPVALPPPPKPVVIAPKTIDINAIPYGEIDAANGAKNMSESKRVIGMVVVGVGSVIQVVTTRLGVGTAIGAVTFDLSRDPVVVALFVGAIVGVIAFVTRKRGTKIVTKGMVEAKQVLK